MCKYVSDIHVTWFDKKHKEQPEIECPICGDIAWDELYINDMDEVVGCSSCITRRDYGDVWYDLDEYEIGCMIDRAVDERRDRQLFEQERR